MSGDEIADSIRLALIKRFGDAIPTEALEETTQQAMELFQSVFEITDNDYLRALTLLDVLGESLQLTLKENL